MFVDASALVAIIAREPEAPAASACRCCSRGADFAQTDIPVA
jgi:uncharacterized protein with PIN domain